MHLKLNSRGFKVSQVVGRGAVATRIHRRIWTVRTGLVAIVCLMLVGNGLLPGQIAFGAGGWTSAGQLVTPRARAVAVRLADGRVLLMGGQTPQGTVTDATEFYTPATNTWSPGPAMNVARTDFTATVLRDGRVLVVGGTNGQVYYASAEIFDPSTSTWSAAAPIPVPRSDHTATLLSDGTVLVVGGYGATGPLADVERYDPATGSWSQADSLLEARAQHTATLLPNGRVLVTGGFGTQGPLSSVAIFDPGIDRWRGFLPPPSMNAARYGQTATLLPNGQVLVVGGVGLAGSLASAELYHPTSGNWVPTAPMSVPRAYHAATLLPNGTVLVTGGAVISAGDTTPTASAEVYDPTSNTWSSAGAMSTTRYYQTATRLLSGQVLVAGGESGSAWQTANLYTPTGVIAPTATPIFPTPIFPTPTPTTLPTATPLPTAAPTATSVLAPSFALTAVRIASSGSGPDWQLVHPSLKRVRVGRHVQLSLYAHFSLPTTAHVAITALVRHKNSTVFHGGSNGDRSGTGDFWYHWTFTPRHPGRYTFTGKVTVNGQTRQASVSFTATVTHPVFAFDRLLTVNAQGKPTSSFARSQRVVILAVITVSHATGTVTMTVGQTLERPVGNGWSPLGKRVQSSFVTTNGTHQYSISFYPQSPYSRIRMVIDITVGKITRRKAVVFAVHS